MAERFVTRTVVFAEVECAVANTETMTMEKKVFTFSGNLTNKSDILEDVKKSNDSETVKIISVDMSTVKKNEILYGMTEQEFMRYAHRMETRTKAMKEEA